MTNTFCQHLQDGRTLTWWDSRVITERSEDRIADVGAGETILWGGHLHVEYKGSRKEVVQAVLEEHGRDCKQFQVLERLPLEVSLTLKSISFKFVMETEKRLTEGCEHLGKCLYGQQMFAATFWISVEPSHVEGLQNSKHLLDCSMLLHFQQAFGFSVFFLNFSNPVKINRYFP